VCFALAPISRNANRSPLANSARSPLAKSRVAQCAPSSYDRRLRTRLLSPNRRERHRAQSPWRLRRRDFGRAATPSRSARRRRRPLSGRKVVGDVERFPFALFAKAASSACRDVGDMNAMKKLTRLRCAARFPRATCFQGVLARAVNPRQPQGRNRFLPRGSQRDPRKLRGKPARGCRSESGAGGGRLVDPVALVVAVNPDVDR